MSAPLITVLIPSYNYREYLGPAIDSILAQTFDDWELLIVDDASTDGSQDLIREYVARFPEKIRAIFLETNGGQVRSQNTGLAAARGKYLALLGSDDIAAPHRLAETAAMLEADSSLGAVFSRVDYIDAAGRFIDAPNMPFNSDFINIRQRLFAGNFINAPSATLNVAAMRKIGGWNTAYSQVEDYDLWLRLLDEHEIRRSDSIWTHYRLHERSLSMAKNGNPHFRMRYEMVICALAAQRRWPIDRMYGLPPADSSERRIVESAALVDLARRCQSLDRHYFGRPLLATGDAYALALRAKLLNPDSTEANALLGTIYRTLGDTPRALGQSGIANADWQKRQSLLPPIITESGEQRRRVSFIICSHRPEMLRKTLDSIQSRIHSLEAEYISIEDARSLADGYNRGIQQASGDILVFCHHDIEILSEDFEAHLVEAMAAYDVVGLAGTSHLVSPTWLDSGPPHVHGQVVYPRDDGYALNIFGDATFELMGGLEALDGYFFATRREVVSRVLFDAETFDGFHLYDLDFTYRCHLAGFRLGVANRIYVAHESPGNYDSSWETHALRFCDKFAAQGVRFSKLFRFHPACQTFSNRSELDAFIAGSPLELPTANQPGGTSGPQAAEYRLWVARKSLQEIDGQLLAERMMKRWSSRPLINLVVEVRESEIALLADTLDSLGTQWYGDWHLTVFAEFPPLSEELAAIPQITWVETPVGGFVSAFNTARNQLLGDWLCFLEPGCVLESHALAYFADAINANPVPRLIYCDEDMRNDAGDFTNPRFKPDWNLEMLRSMNYLGPCLLLEKQTVLASGDAAYAGSAGFYDLALKFAECFDSKRLVHLPEILVHTPSSGLRDLDSDGEMAVLQGHFDRIHSQAQISSGFVAGTQCVTYPPIGSPLVSIIIPTRDQPGYLQHCIDSLLQETSYPNYEIIIVDHDTTDPDALEYIGDLSERSDLAVRIQCIRTDGPFNWARLANLGASFAQGEFLLFLDNDTEIIQPAWLDHLVGLCQQSGMVAVGPRLSTPDSQYPKLNQLPRILGLGGLAGALGPENSTILEPGYCGRLQISQEISALSGSCLLVRHPQFINAGRFDEDNTPIYEAALGLCLRLGEAGGKLAWTPWVDIAHRDGISRQRMEGDPYERSRLTNSALAERDYLLGRHLPQLANDPHYHRQLSLQQPFAIEPHIVIDWDTRYHDRLRLLGLPLTSGSGEYRMLAPFRAIQKAGLAQTCFIHPIQNKLQRVLNPIELARAAPDTLVLQQAIDDAQINQLKQYRRFNKDVFITYCIDDVMGNLPRKHYLYNFHAREGKSRMREGLSNCDRLIASTEPIADYCRGMADDIVVVPNRLDGNMWLSLASKQRAGKKPRVGWAGAQQHLGDLEMIKDVVETLRDEVEWVFMGMCPAFLKPYVAEEHAFVSFVDYPGKLASLNLDVAIAPLEQHFFNEGKSNLRLLEYGIMGWPVVCSDIYPYQTNNAPVTRVNNIASEWIAAIRERIYDLDNAEREGEVLRQWVLKHYILEDHLDQWIQAFAPPSFAKRQTAK
jgi:glycosyltransferase involved in cell wall biosynthesis